MAEVLGGNNVDGFQRAAGPRDFGFPEDHGPHPGFRNEWWYLTGNLYTLAGRRFGYQVTFFSAAPAPEVRSAGQERESAWESPRVWMAHAALTDVKAARHHVLERFSRENPGLAGARLDPFRVWLENWRLESEGNGFPWRLTLEDPDFSLTLEFDSRKDPVLQGENGLSLKSPDPGNASYYYSITRLATDGEIRVGGSAFAVSGQSWLDREWSTSALAADQSGWDWFALQFTDGAELMYYQLRDAEGGAHPFSRGNWTSPSGAQTPVAPDRIALAEVETWTSPAGVTYATSWRVDYRSNRWLVKAVLADQWMDVSLLYWEGAVDVLDAGSGEKLGEGYLEMVRQ